MSKTMPSYARISQRGEMNLENNEQLYGAGIIPGRNPVAEALRSGRAIDCLYVAKGQHSGQIPALIAKAKAAGIPIKEADSRKLGQSSGRAGSGRRSGICRGGGYAGPGQLPGGASPAHFV